MATVIYARKSSERDDRQALSLEAQVRVLKEVAAREKIAVAEIIQEAGSAKTPGTRPKFKRMVSQIEKGHVQGILTWHVNRLGRNSVDGGMISYLLQTRKLGFIRTPERAYWPEDNALILSVETGMAVNYIQNLSRDVKRGLREKVGRGWYHGCAPYGYINNPATRQVDPHPTEFPILQQAWKLFLTGAYSVQDVQREVERMGLKGRQRGGHERPANRTTLYRVFANSFYAGELTLNGKKYPGKHLPMVTKGEFWQAQELLGRKTFVRPKSNSFVFSGTLKCGKCGCAVVGERKVKKSSSGRIEYTYYHCSGSRGCPKVGISERRLMESLETFYEKIGVTDGHVDSWCRLALSASASKDGLAHGQSRSKLQADLGVLRQRSDRLKSYLLDGEIDPHQFHEFKTEIDADITDKSLLLDKIEAQVESLNDMIRKKLEAASELSQLYGLSEEKIKGHLWCLGENHTLTLGKLHLKVDPIVQKILSLELPVNGSDSGGSPDKQVEFSFWSAKFNEVRTFASMQYPGDALDEELKRMSGPVKTGPRPSPAP